MSADSKDDGPAAADPASRRPTSPPESPAIPAQWEEVLKTLPAEQRATFLAIITQHNWALFQARDDLLPIDPEKLRQIDLVVPGSAQKLTDAFVGSIDADVAIAKSDAEARNKIARSEPVYKYLTLIAGIFIMVLLIGAAIWAALNGFELLAAAFIGSAALTTVPRIVTAWRKRDSDRPIQE